MFGSAGAGRMNSEGSSGRVQFGHKRIRGPRKVSADGSCEAKDHARLKCYGTCRSLSMIIEDQERRRNGEDDRQSYGSLGTLSAHDAG